MFKAVSTLFNHGTSKTNCQGRDSNVRPWNHGQILMNRVTTEQNKHGSAAQSSHFVPTHPLIESYTLANQVKWLWTSRLIPGHKIRRCRLKVPARQKASSTEVILIEQLWKANAFSTVIWMCQLESWIPSKCEVWCSILLETLHVFKTIFRGRNWGTTMLSKDDEWSVWELFAGFDNLSTSLYSMPIVMSCSHRNAH